MSEIGVFAGDPALYSAARALAGELGLPLADNAPLLLELTPERLQLREAGASGPVYVDFVGGQQGYRRQHGGGRGQPLARAIGFKGGHTPEVLDATAGLGRDAFVLATLGCAVRMIERSPVLAALLADGLRRAAQVPDTAPIVERLSLIRGDSIALMQSLQEEARPEVVYLDPMYPPRHKTALVKKEMRLLQTLLGHAQDSAGLLAAALACARRRVVVKRPKGAEALPGPLPSGSISSPNTRFDLYSVSSV
jgi:16S rRNA (guanine1516-N2)-methyltransferase